MYFGGQKTLNPTISSHLPDFIFSSSTSMTSMSSPLSPVSCDPTEPPAPARKAALGDIPQHTLKRAGQIAVRDAVEAVYSRTATAAAASNTCSSSAASLAKWASELPQGLYNNATSSSLRRATNRMFLIKAGRETPWEDEEMRTAIRDAICGHASVRQVAKAALLRKWRGGPPRLEDRSLQFPAHITVHEHVKRAREAIEEAGATSDEDIRRVIHDLPFPSRGARPYLNDEEKQLIGETISLRAVVGKQPGRAAIRASLLESLKGREETADATCNPKYMKRLMKEMKKKNLLSAHKPTAVARSRAKQRDPNLAKELASELNELWAAHHEAKLLRTTRPEPCQLFNMDEIG